MNVCGAQIPRPKGLGSEDGEMSRCLAAVWLLSVGLFGCASTPELIDRLDSPIWRVRRAASRKLRKIDSLPSEYVAALIRALGSDYQIAYETAIRSLVKIGDPALPQLLEAVRDPNIRINSHAAIVLGRIGTQGSIVVPALIEIVADPDAYWWGLRRNAVEALGAYGRQAEAAVPVLIPMLKDIARRGPAAKLLGRIGPAAEPAVPALMEALQQWDLDVPHVGRPREVLCWDIVSGLQGIGPAGIDALLRALESDDSHLRLSATIAFSRVRVEDGRVVEPLVRLVTHDVDVRIRTAAAYAIANQRHEKVMQAEMPLLEALARDEPVVASAAARAVAVLGSKRAVPALTEALGHDDPGVRASAATALTLIGTLPEVAVSALQKALNDDNARVRSAASRALRYVRTETPLKP